MQHDKLIVSKHLRMKVDLNKRKRVYFKSLNDTYSMGKTISMQKYMNARKIDALSRNIAVLFVKPYRTIQYTVSFLSGN